MFKILTKYMNTDELRILCELWEEMNQYFTTIMTANCDLHKDCSGCKYKRLCGALDSTKAYLKKELAKREAEQ